MNLMIGVVYLEMTIQVKQITPIVNKMTILKLIRKGADLESLQTWVTLAHFNQGAFGNPYKHTTASGGDHMTSIFSYGTEIAISEYL